MLKVLVTGATGNVGRHVVRELQTRGASVRALVRDPAAAAATLGDVELAVGDFGDVASLRRALHGVDRVFLTSADGPDKVAHECALIDAAAAEWVQQVVKLSTIHARAGSPLPTFDWHGRIEEHLARVAVPAAVLQSTFFMSNLLMSAQAVASTGQLFAPAGTGHVAMIDPRDAAAAAAALLTSDGHAGRSYLVTGGEAVAFTQVAEAFAAAAGRPVQYIDIPEEAAQQAFTGAGLPDWLITQLLGAFRLIREGAYAATTDTLHALTGQRPRTVGEFARDHSALFAPASTMAQ